MGFQPRYPGSTEALFCARWNLAGPSAVHLPAIEARPEVNSLIWLVGAIVIVLAILSLLGLR